MKFFSPIIGLIAFLSLNTTIIAQEAGNCSACTEFSLVLKASGNTGIGIFATHDIPEGTEVFSKHYAFKTRRIDSIPNEFLKYCVFINDIECVCPAKFDHMEISWYLNHSDNPNIATKSDQSMVAIRDIKEGEEILMNYNELNEPNHLKEAYYYTGAASDQPAVVSI